MTGDNLRFASAAAGLAGTPFRLHGRDARTGLDCVGLVGAALTAAGRRAICPVGYRLRALDVGEMLHFAARNGFRQVVDGSMEGGDLILVRPAPVQFHLVIANRTSGFVHAHAGLGRVTIMPAPMPWPIVDHWRLQ